MKLRSVVICLVVVSLCLGTVALLAKPAPELTLKTAWDRATGYFIIPIVKHGVEPFTYLWSYDGGPFQEEPGGFIECSFQTSVAVQVVDAEGQESNVETFVCP